MPDIIQDGTGQGYLARVDSTNRLSTKTISTAGQNFYSRRNQDAYQVSTQVNIDTSNQPILFLENISSDKHLVITYIRMMSAGAAASNETAYFTINVGGTYSSGGAAISPVNMFVGTAKLADTIAYSGSTPLVLSGFTEIDRSHQANEMVTYNKEGSLVLDTKQAISINHIGSTVAGVAYARISFYFIDKGDI